MNAYSQQRGQSSAETEIDSQYLSPRLNKRPKHGISLTRRPLSSPSWSLIIDRERKVAHFANTIPIPQASMNAPPVTSRVAPCECHVLNPKDWPEDNSKICIALCMHICPYCGLDFKSSYGLNVHLSTSEYKDRGLEAIWIPRKESELQ